MDRVFVAIFPPAETQVVLGEYATRLKSSLKQVRWSKPENLHYTLRFLGDRSGPEQRKVSRALHAASALAAPFTLEITDLGVFPNERRPRVFWLGAGQGANTLEALARAVDRELKSKGFEPRDKPFTAHLTLGRSRAPAHAALSDDFMSQLPRPGTWRIPIEELCLVRSILGQGPPRYEILERAPLDGGGAIKRGAKQCGRFSWSP